MRVRGARIHVIFEEMSTVYRVVPPFLIGYPGSEEGGGAWLVVGETLWPEEGVRKYPLPDPQTQALPQPSDT